MSNKITRKEYTMSLVPVAAKDIDTIRERLLKAITSFDKQFEFHAEKTTPDGKVVLAGPPGSFVVIVGTGEDQLNGELGIYVSVNGDAAITGNTLIAITKEFGGLVHCLGPMIEIQAEEGIAFTSDLQEVYETRQEYILAEAQRIIMGRGQDLRQEAAKSPLVLSNTPNNAAQALRQSIGAEPKIVLAR